MSKSPHYAKRAQYRRNLRRLYARATDADRREGLAWYPTAVAACQTWSQGLSVPAETIACVIAAISPQCDWSSNLRIAFELLSGQTLVTGGALRANVDKARRILRDRHTSVYPVFKVAPKVASFAENLKGYAGAVTVDTHAVQAAMNAPTVFRSIHPGAYAIFAGLYADVATELGLRPCDFQAIIWCVWKRKYPRERKRALQRQERQNNG